MIKSVRLDLSQNEFLYLHNKIRENLILNPLDSKSRTFCKDIYDLINPIVSNNYILYVAENIRFHIQAKKESSWIFTIKHASVLIFKPKPFVLPKLEFIHPINLKLENKKLHQFSVLNNDLLNDEQIIIFEKYLITILELKLKSKDTIGDIVPMIRPFFMKHSKGLSLHTFISPSKSTFFTLNNNSLEKVPFISITFKERDNSTSWRLIVFDKRTLEDSLIERCFNKWKEFMFILIIIFFLLVIMSCSRNKSVLFISTIFFCQNKETILFTIGILGVGIFLIKKIQKIRKFSKLKITI